VGDEIVTLTNKGLMKLDIVICTYNRSLMLERLLESINSAEIPKDVDVNLIVVNNNSTDTTQDVIRRFSSNGRIGMIPLFERQIGKVYALNKALEYLKGDIVAFTDDDVIVDRFWIREIVSAVKRNTSYNCFGGRVLVKFIAEPPRWLKLNGQFSFLQSVFAHRDEGDREVEYGKDTISATPGGVNMFFRRPVLERNGLFRTDLGPKGKVMSFSEDTEFCERLMKRGERFLYIPSAVVYHLIPPQRVTRGYLLKWQYRCGRSEVRRQGGYKDYRVFLGVPRYLLKKFIIHLTGSVFTLSKEKRFYHQLRFSYTSGELIEHLSLRR